MLDQEFSLPWMPSQRDKADTNSIFMALSSWREIPQIQPWVELLESLEVLGMGINYHQIIPKANSDHGNAGIVPILPHKTALNCSSFLKMGVPGGVGNPGLDLGSKGTFLLFSNPSGRAGMGDQPWNCWMPWGTAGMLGGGHGAGTNSPWSAPNPGKSLQLDEAGRLEFWGGILGDAAPLGRAAFLASAPWKSGIGDPWDVPKALSSPAYADPNL